MHASPFSFLVLSFPVYKRGSRKEPECLSGAHFCRMLLASFFSPDAMKMNQRKRLTTFKVSG